MRPTTMLRGPLTVALAAVLGVLLLGAAPAQAQDASADPSSGVDTTTLPAAARDALPLITELTTTQCAELPPVWVVAQVQAESGWDPTLRSDRSGGAAGLYQFGQRNWEAAGGAQWPSDPPSGDSDVLSPEAHLRVAVPWICTHLRAVTEHLATTGKTTAPLDAMLVCHLAGCGRVTGSATGIPVAGEAGCGERCVQVIGRYITAVHHNVERFAAPAGAPPAPGSPADPLAAPAPWTGGATGCKEPDPTGDGCLTGAARHGFEAASTAFGGWSDGPVIRSAGCWDKHAWNPRSDHPRGKACDLFATKPGTFAGGAELDSGWKLAGWLRTNAEPLHVRYLIWQGRYWDPTVNDQGGDWGRRYTGGGVYNVRNATGGHYDHVHVSFRE